MHLKIAGGPAPVVSGVSRTAFSGAANFDVSRDGSLVYLAGPGGGERTLVWVHRDGREEAIDAEPARYTEARVAPDGRTAVVSRGDQESDLWIWDFERETMNRLTFGAAVEQHPVWTPDGRSIIFASNRMSGREMFRTVGRCDGGRGPSFREGQRTVSHGGEPRWEPPALPRVR